MAPDRPGVLAAIGRTPVVRLSRLVEPGVAEVWVKLESYNPTGSYKDRMALAMIEGAERAGKLQPGQPVVEYTGGSTGSSLALVCALKGYPLRIVSSDAFAPEKVRTMRAFGAEVELLPSPEGITPTLIPRMRARLPSLHRVAVEPAESAVLAGGRAGTHRIEGGGVGFIPPQLALDDFDEVISVPTETAFETARRATRADGVWGGPSTGANIAAALALARRLGPGARVATIQVDSGRKYLSGGVYS